METVAMYWEPRIKTYGFQVIKNLSLYAYAFSDEIWQRWGQVAGQIDADSNRFQLVCAQQGEAGHLELMLLCNPEQGAACARRLEIGLAKAACPPRVTSPVELIIFQGPHFGDRFGIADFTCRALKEQVDDLLAAVFSSASIYLVLPQGVADKARDRLAAAFRVPG